MLRHLLCLLPTWSAHRILELVPAFWAQTAQRDEVILALEANPFRRATDIQPDGIQADLAKRPDRGATPTTRSVERIRSQPSGSVSV